MERHHSLLSYTLLPPLQPENRSQKEISLFSVHSEVSPQTPLKGMRQLVAQNHAGSSVSSEGISPPQVNYSRTTCSSEESQQCPYPTCFGGKPQICWVLLDKEFLPVAQLKKL